MSQELYDTTAYDLSRRLTLRYSTSFGLASRLFSAAIRPHIYAIYGMVRVADEIVDTFDGSNKAELLTSFQNDIHACLASGYSTNPIIHAFCLTARQYAITAELIDPFFNSMAMDLTKTSFSKEEYDAYIYGSAEVVGLMCLKVFCANDTAQYQALAPGARILGSAYQKVNFIRDFSADYHERRRIYFPALAYDEWTETTKQALITDVTKEFVTARQSIADLPAGARTSVYLSYLYYWVLLKRLTRLPAENIKTTRAHVSTPIKLGLLLYAPIGARLLRREA